ncbi:transferase hexapeptide repeat containing protein [Desulfoscipio gibsoniae]|uniref:transferase hexapeptide repeat containing protein n=1 Tax=Desulfoscipio gibsoniae TaxID=102134 RepID=UPI000232B357|nr:transferase hexapeptide repeat containing protein [Desulfoscipio gibsoniae]
MVGFGNGESQTQNLPSINLGCTVGHDTILGNFASIMPGVMIAGSVKIGIGVYIGIGSSIINGVNIGDWSLIGSGATVANSIPDHVLAIGVPAKPIKNYNPL